MKQEESVYIKRRLFFIRLLHTVIWLVYAFVIFYLFYAALINKIDLWVWIGVGLVMIEGIVLLTYKWTCPMTLMARKYTSSGKDNFDIFLPEWIARYNKALFTWMFILSMVIILYRIF